MKLDLAFLAALLASLPGHAQTASPTPLMSELRMAILQSREPAGTAAPRRLSAEERAELRRQVLEQSRRFSK